MPLFEGAAFAGTGGFSDCVLGINRGLIKDIRKHPAEYYVNVHSTPGFRKPGRCAASWRRNSPSRGRAPRLPPIRGKGAQRADVLRGRPTLGAFVGMLLWRS